MFSPTVLRSLNDFSCKARNAGSAISINTTIKASLFARINRPCRLIWRIGNRASVRDKSPYICRAECISVRRHERRPIQRRSAVEDDGSEISIAHLVERVAVGECMGLYLEIIEV